MKEKFQQLNTIFLALLAGQLLFAGVVIFLLNSGEASEPPENDIFEIIVPMALIGALGVTYYFTRQRKEGAKSIHGLEDQFAHYRGTVIFRSAVLESANLLTVIAMLVQKDLTTYLLYFVVGILAFLYFRPSTGRFINEYDVPEKDAGQLR